MFSGYVFRNGMSLHRVYAAARYLAIRQAMACDSTRVLPWLGLLLCVVIVPTSNARADIGVAIEGPPVASFDSIQVRRAVGLILLGITGVALLDLWRRPRGSGHPRRPAASFATIPSCASDTVAKLRRPSMLPLAGAFAVLILVLAMWLGSRAWGFMAPVDLPMVGSIRPGWSAPIWLTVLTVVSVLLQLAAPLYPPIGVCVYIAVAYGMPRYSAEWDLIHRLHLPSWIAVLAGLSSLLRYSVDQGSFSVALKQFWPRDRLVQGMLALALWSGVSLLVANFSSGVWLAEQSHHPLRLLDATLLFLIAWRYLAHPTASWLMAAVLGVTIGIRAFTVPGRIHLDGDLALLAAISIPLTFLSIFATTSWQRQGTLVVLCGLLVKVLFETQNRGGAVAVLAAVLVAWLFSRRKGLLLLVIVGAIWFVQTDYWTRFSDYLSGTEGVNRKTAESRLRIWESALRIAADHPFVGVGWGNTFRWSAEYGAGEEGITTHNNLLGILTETGIPGLGLYLALFGSIAWSLGKRIRAAEDFASREGRAVLCGIAAYFAGGMFLTRHDLILAYVLAGWGVGLRALPLAFPTDAFAWLPQFRSPGRNSPPRVGDEVPCEAGRLWYFPVAAVLATLLAIYGSLVPLEFRSITFTEAVERFRNIRYLELGIQSRSDLVANVLLFVPLGFLWSACWVRSGRRCARELVKGAVIVMALLLLACSIEFTQLWFPRRTVSLNDILAESTGGLIGVSLWLVSGGWLLAWLRRVSGTHSDRWMTMLRCYAIGLAIYSLLPFDATIRPSEIYEKYKLGRIVLVPFTSLHSSILQNVYDLGLDIALLIPIGLLCVLRSPRQTRPLPMGFLLGMGYVFGLEIAQLFLFSRYSDVTDLVTGALGISIGIGIGARSIRRWNGQKEKGSAAPLNLDGRDIRKWWLAAGGYVLVLAVVFWAPFDFHLEPEFVKPRVKDFLRVPFQVLYVGNDFNAMLQVLRKGLWFAPLGGLVYLGARSSIDMAMPRGSLRWRTWASVGLSSVFVLSVAAVIEGGQLFLPDKIFDLTDVILCTLGGAMGVLLAKGLLRRE
jgi:glycopeptide antibiotics resistance protein